MLVAILTVVSPRWSVYGFILASPLLSVGDALGWDPRLRWAIILVLRGAWESWNTGLSCVPRTAWKIWSVFVILAAGGLCLRTTGLTADDVEGAQSALLYFIVSSCAVYAIWQLVRSSQELRRLFAVFATTLCFAAFIGIGQAIILYRSGEPVERITGSFGNPNGFGIYLALGATTLVLLMRSGMLNRAYGCFACGAAVIGCLLALSRAALAAMLLGIGMALFIRAEKKLLSVRTVAVTLGAAVLGATLMATYVVGVRRGITYSTENDDTELVVTGQAAEDFSRLEAFQYSVQLAAQHPITGIGVGTFEAWNYRANGLYVTTHNAVMQVLVATGVLGGILMTWLLVCLAKPLAVPVRRFIFPAVAAFGICALFADFLQSMDIYVIFAVLYLCARHLDRTNVFTTASEGRG